MSETQRFVPDEARAPKTEAKSHLTQFGGKQYDVRKLEAAAKSLPIRQFDLSNRDVLEPILKGKYWKDSNGNSIGPNDLLAAFEENKRDWSKVAEAHPEWSEHIAKTMRVNYEMPVLVHDGNLIDGIHRLTKALSENSPTLPIKILDELPSEAEYIK